VQKRTQERPLVTFVLFAYNQENYIRDAIEGAFSQTYEPLEIILSDDCSSDRTFELMQELAAAYNGPHEVRLRRNETNLGVGGHINAAFLAARGDILLVAAGDDISLADRAEVSVDYLEANPAASAVLLSADTIDQHGEIIGELLVAPGILKESTQSIEDLLKWNHVTFGATRAVRKNVFEKFGNFNDGCPTEDTTLLVRSLILGDNVLSSKKSVRYRVHEQNISRPEALQKMKTNEIYRQYTCDINVAEQGRLIDSKKTSQLRRWILEDERVRGVNLKKNLGIKCSSKEFLFIIFHRAFSLKQKAFLLVGHFFQAES
jgi:glycosyltransferase involved in cell wall biosynthesis